METRSLGFVGGGRITKILLKGFKNAGIELQNVVVYDPNEESLLKLKEMFPGIIIADKNLDTVAMSDVVFVAVHPPMVLETLEKMKPFVQENAMIISLAPKITINQIQSILQEVKSIARVNPNAPNIINQGVNPVAFSQTVMDQDKAYFMKLFGKLGKTFVVDEAKIEAYAIICAMGSTYFWFQLQHLQELGVEFGMEPEEAKQVLRDMLNGTINTLFFSEIPSNEAMDLVPVKPIGEYEQNIKSIYTEKLTGIFNKIKP